MDVRCLCSPPSLNISPALHCGVHSLPSDPGVQSSCPWRSCGCMCRSSRCHQGLCCCKQPASRISACATNDKSPSLLFIKPSPPAYVLKSQHAICPGQCAHFHPQCSAVDADRRRTAPVKNICTAFSRQHTGLTEHEPIPAKCTIHSLDRRSPDSTERCCCCPSAPTHYAVYSSPCSLSSSAESGHIFPNNVPPVLLAVYPDGKGPCMEKLAQIDRSPTPCIASSYSAFSRDYCTC